MDITVKINDKEFKAIKGEVCQGCLYLNDIAGECPPCAKGDIMFGVKFEHGVIWQEEIFAGLATDVLQQNRN